MHLKNLERSSFSQLWDTIPEFAWYYWTRQRKHSDRTSKQTSPGMFWYSAYVKNHRI